MERWNGGMDFFLHPFCLLVCLLTIILWLSFQFACFYFRQSCFSTRLCAFVLLFFNQGTVLTRFRLKHSGMCVIKYILF